MRSLRTANSLTSRNIGSAPPARTLMLYHYSEGLRPSQGSRADPREPLFFVPIWSPPEVPVDIAVGRLRLQVGAMGCQRAAFTLRFGALANLLAVLFQQQVSALPRFERLGQSCVQEPSRGPVIGGIVLSWFAHKQPHGNVHERGRYGRNRRQPGKQQYLFRAGLPDCGKFLEHFLRELEIVFCKIVSVLAFGFLDALLEGCRKVSVQFGLYRSRDIPQPLCTHLGHDYARPHQLRKFRLGNGQELVGLDANLSF